MNAELSYAGLALWLVPSPQSSTSQNLSSLISSLAAQHDTPAFLPHITLLSGIPRQSLSEVGAGTSDLSGVDAERTNDVLERVRKAVIDWRREGSHENGVDAVYAKLGTKPTPFQYLFVQITKSPALLTLHQSLARQLTAPHSSSTQDPHADEDDQRAKVAADYFPHLSLMYGVDSLSPPRNSHQIISTLVRDGLATSPPHSDSTEILSGENKCTVGGEGGFRGKEIVVMDCEGPVSGWVALGRVSLIS